MRTTPKEYTSDDSSYFSPLKISGAIQFGVPMRTFLAFSGSAGVTRVVSYPRETEVRELDVPVSVHEDVGALEVAVENFFLVKIDHGLGDVYDDFDDPVDLNLDHFDMD